MHLSPAVSINKLSFAYKNRLALQEVTIEVNQGEIFGLLGPNGSGKTTLFRILSTMALPSRGQASIFGYDVGTDSEYVRRSIGVVFQSFALDKKLRVRENLFRHGQLYGLTGSLLRSRIESVLRSLGIWERKEELVETLSGGLQRRVEIAKGLLHQPKLLLMDEPSTGLDPGARIELWRILSQLRNEQKTTILLTTHILEEAERCDRLSIMDRGRVIVTGTPQQLKKSIGGDIVSVVPFDPERLTKGIRRTFKLTPKLVDGILHIEKKNGHAFLPKLVQKFPNQIRSVTVGKPTLEDVFIKYTGHAFGGAELK